MEVKGTKITIAEDEKGAANIFNNYFCGIAGELLGETDTSLINFSNLEGQNSINVLDKIKLTKFDIISAINKLPCKNSVGPDGIKIIWLKTNSEKFADVLLPLFNKSLEKGEFPDIFKKSIVLPIFKKGNKELLSNYRPISLLSNISKIFELCVKKKDN